jgi:hypothetical protein
MHALRAIYDGNAVHSFYPFNYTTNGEKLSSVWAIFVRAKLLTNTKLRGII